MSTVRDIASFIEAWAPPASALDYDNVGLQIGRPNRSVEKVLVALEVTLDVVNEALEIGADLIVVHHPLIFRPLKSVTSESREGGLALRIAESGIALYAAHTNLDAATGGVSFALADKLGLRDVTFLSQLEDVLYKLAVFVPESHAAKVRDALAGVGAGVIGDYDACAFETAGTGYFRPGDQAQPFLGAKDGSVQSASEMRLEVEIARWRLPGVMAALKESHPYEEVAYDLYRVAQPFRNAGHGAIGNLPRTLSQTQFLNLVAERLEAQGLRFSGPDEIEITRVAVCGGAGSELLGKARQAGAHAFVTSDISYHRFFEVYDESGGSEMLLVDAGHYETEQATEHLLVERLSAAFPDLDITRTNHRTGPVRYLDR